MAIDDQSLAELVKEIRRQLFLSQEDLARALGISFATVDRMIEGLCFQWQKTAVWQLVNVE